MIYETYKLKEIADIVMGQSPKGSSYNNFGEGIPFMQGRKTFGRMYNEIDTYTTSPTKIAKMNSILISVRAPVGDVNIANMSLCIGRGLASINMKNGNNTYLYYLLLNSVEKLKSNSTGTVFDSINKETLENITLNVHTEEQQNKISRILLSLDNKIELNNQINDNLLLSTA